MANSSMRIVCAVIFRVIVNQVGGGCSKDAGFLEKKDKESMKRILLYSFLHNMYNIPSH